MHRTRKAMSLLVVGLMAAAFVAMLAAPAGAEVIQGKCTGSATFTEGGVTVTEQQPIDQTVIVPEKDTVIYSGSTGLDKPTEPVEFTGGIDVALPIGGWTVVTWGGMTEENSVDEGTYTYEVPGFVPRGTGGLEVTATHTQQGQTCVVAVTMALDGEPGAAAWVAGAGAIVFFAATMAAGTKKKVV